MSSSRAKGLIRKCSAVEGRGGGVKAGKIYRGLAVRKGVPGPNMLHMFCRLYKLTLGDQDQVALHLRSCLSDLV